MNDYEDRIYCTDGSQCGGKEFSWKNQIEPGIRFVCLKCQKAIYGVDIMDFLKTKMGHIKKATNDSYRFAIRELIQNADDVNAGIVTIRLDDDSMYVANNGYAFRPSDKEKGWEGDYVRICRVLSRPKAKEAEATGAHGSGFQTVYCFTNHPKVHSSGISAKMNPTITDERNRIIGMPSLNQAKWRSPYYPDGVLFQFDWRNEDDAQKDYDGRQCFASEDWPRWDSKEIVALVEDLRDYLHELILCCQHVEIIRLIWGHPLRAYQVQRIGFTLDTVSEKSYIARVEEGFIEISEDWETGFSKEDWKWQKRTSPEGGWRYLIDSAYVTNDEGQRLYYGEDNKGRVIITTDIEELAEDESSPIGKSILLKGNIHMLLPLFDTSKRLSGRPTYYRYSVLPIPYLGKNRFVSTAHVIVDEDRSSLKLGDKYNANWLKMVIVSLKDLYLKLFEDYLNKIYDLEIPIEEKQELIMNNLPGMKLHSWINPKDEMADDLVDQYHTLLRELVKMDILYSLEDAISPLEAYWVDDDENRWLVDRLGGRTFNEAFKDHELFSVIGGELEDCKFKNEDFLNLWERFEANNRVEGHLKLNQELEDGNALDADLISGLIKFCLKSEDQEIHKIAIIPDKNGMLRSIEDYPFVPKGYEPLHSLLKKEKRINNDFKQLVRSLYKIDISPNDVVRTLSDAIKSQEKRFKELNQDDHKSIVNVLVKAVTDSSFALEDVSDCKFIPFKYQGSVQIGEPNKEPNGDLLDYKHIGESYLQNHIFKVQRKKVPGLTEEIRRGIKMLSLSGVRNGMVEEVEKKLRLVALFEKGSPVPTNFVRVYVSPKQASLFDDINLQRFLFLRSKLSEKNITNKVLENQKHCLLDAVKTYFRPGAKGTETGLTKDDMKIVPCLYNTKGEWHNAGDFAMNIDETLEMLRKHSLHPDFLTEEWPKEVLVGRLGVCESPDLGDVVEAILKLTKSDKNNNREKLKEILIYLLTSNIDLVDKNNVALKDRPEIKDLKWVPTKNKKFKSLNVCLFPSKRNIDIFGPEYSRFLDLSSRINDEPNIERIIERTKQLGILTEPKLDDLLGFVALLFESKTTPPLRLFDSLSSETYVREGSIYHKQVYARVYFDYNGGKWWRTNDIRIMDESNVPPQLRDEYLFVHPNNPHRKYLAFFLGVEEELYDDEILDYMVSNEPEIDFKLWSFLARTPERGEELREEYGSLRIFPNPDNTTQRLRPDRIVVREEETFREPGFWGDWFVIDPEDKHIDMDIIRKLKSLGTKMASELSSETIGNILDSMAWDGKSIDISSYEKIMRLLLRLAVMAVKDERIVLDHLCAPIKMVDGTVCKRVSECYLNDTFKSALFKGTLPILDDRVDGESKEELLKLYAENGALSLDKTLQTRPKRHPIDPEHDPPQTLRFRELKKALLSFFERRILDEDSKPSLRESVQWLGSCEVMRYDDIQVEYVVKGITASRSTSGYDIEREGGIFRINIARVGAREMMKKLANEIFKTCESTSSSHELSQIESEMILIINELLSSDLRDWEYVIPGYSFDGDEPPPLLLEIVEFTTEGYFDTRHRLKAWYNACQICMTRTPFDDSGYESCEGTTSVISMKGGRYRGKFEKYSPANCLFLCPTHQTLYKRGLIKIPYLELSLSGDNIQAKNKVDDTRARIKKKIKDKEYGVSTIVKDIWHVFETPVEKFKTNKSQWDWNEKNVHFRVEHFLELLDWISDYLRGIEHEQG